MSNDNLWGDEEPFSDMPEEAQTGKDGKPVPPSYEFVPPPPSRPIARPAAGPTPPVPPVKAPISVQEEIEVEEEPEEDFSDVLSDAHLRLEQGGLYKMIMNHNLFDGTDADPKAVQNVQKEIRAFARERMEVMLGMRRETATVEHLEIDFPFNAMEVDVLKKLAYKASLGETQNSDNFVPEVRRTVEEVPTVSKKKTLNPIGATKKATNKPLQNKPSAPVKRSKLDTTIDQIAREEGIPRELLEEDLPGVGGKSLNQLTDQELIERNRLAAKRRGAQVKSANALPMATPEQQEMMAVERAAQMSASGSLMSRILETVKQMPIKS